MAYACKIIADSVNHYSGSRLTTFEITFPRFLLAELNTHRTLSRCSASSRAIPVAKRIAAIEADPFIPLSFGKNQKGMQATDELEAAEQAIAEVYWREDIANAIRAAKRYAELGVHKQLANRVLELYSWHTAIVSGTEWQNLFHLRNHAKAQPEFQVIAKMLEEAYNACEPRTLYAGEWHLPFVDHQTQLMLTGNALARVSAGRCARVSYLTHDGKVDPEADMALADRLIADGHMSPLEHPAKCLPPEDYASRHDGYAPSNYHPSWVQYRKMIPNESVWPRDEL